MKIDFSPRASGKTTKLIEWLKENQQRLLVTFNFMEAKRLKDRYPLLAAQIISWDVWVDRDYHIGFFKEVSIDNVDMIISNYARLEKLKNISLSSDEK